MVVMLRIEIELMPFIYALSLENSKYYIGKMEHIQTFADDECQELCKMTTECEWLKTNRPLRVVEYIRHADIFDQDKMTLQYMEKYGIVNVRGGSFSKTTLSHSEISLLQRMIRHARNECYTCGHSGHVQRNCSEEKWIQLRNRCFVCHDSSSIHRVQDCPQKNFPKLPIYHFQDTEKLPVTYTSIPNILQFTKTEQSTINRCSETEKTRESKQPMTFMNVFRMIFSGKTAVK